MGLVISLWASAISAAELSIKEIADGVYIHIGQHHDFDEKYDGDIANIGFIVGKDSVAVIDTGGSYKVGVALRKAVRVVTDLPIRYVINTHIHPDHIFGNAAFIQDKPEFIGHSRLPAILNTNKESLLNSLKQQLKDDAAGSEIVVPSKTVVDEMKLDLGGRILNLRAWPKAHTSTDITVFDDLTKTLWTGDLLFIERAPSLDGDLKGWLAVIQQMKQIPAKLTVPGHGKPTTDLDGMLDKESTYLTVLLNEVRASIKKGVDLLKALDTVAQSERSKWELFDVVNRRNINLAYPQLEWE